jgi:hypothetical protein
MIPLMNTGERGYFDALTELVLGAVFEVSNTPVQMTTSPHR